MAFWPADPSACGSTVRLWNPATGRPVGAPLRASAQPGVSVVAFSPYGKLLASASGDSLVALRPDGKTSATGNGDGTVGLWDVATHREIGKPLKGHVTSVTAVAFSTDGKTLAIGSLDGTVQLWNMTTHGQNVAKIADLVPYLCASAGRPLTRTEWARYVPQGLAYQRVCP